ncbi:MAG: hypothetical protein HYX78_14860 [Armatimonadetes bacterium]|nr:hypothetical protein [Armatimonadota bacterium]
MKARQWFLLAASCAIATVFSTVPGQAQARTTPVEVTNLLGIDPNNNTVKAQQLGAWTVSLSGTAAVTQSGSWSVGITGTPNMNVANTPNVNVANIPMVKIDSATNTVKIDSNANTVKTPTQRNMVQLWTTNQTVNNGGIIFSAWISASGYKEMRFVIRSSSSSENLLVHIIPTSPTGSGYYLGRANFAAASGSSFATGGNWVAEGGTCVFSMPVVADLYVLQLKNNTGGTVTVYDSSWAYLVN